MQKRKPEKGRNPRVQQMPKPGFRVWQNVRVTRVPGFFKTRVSIPNSDTAAMTPCSRRSQYVNSLSLVTANAARTALGIKREVEQIRSNAFYSTF